MNQANELFFELLRKAKEYRHISKYILKAYLIGYRDSLKAHYEDIDIADSSRDYQRHINSGHTLGVD